MDASKGETEELWRWTCKVFTCTSDSRCFVELHRLVPSPSSRAREDAAVTCRQERNGKCIELHALYMHVITMAQSFSLARVQSYG